MFSNYISGTAFALIAIALTLCYFYVKYLYSYWIRRGVPQLTPVFPFGNFAKNCLQKLSMGEQLDELYHSTDEPFIGIYTLLRPAIIVRDPSLIRNILVKDFQHFVDRGVYFDEENDPLSAHFFSIEGDRWRNLRRKLSATFTSGKMRTMFRTLCDCQRSLQKYVSQAALSEKLIEAREFTACYSTNVIASVAFGIDVDCLADPNSPIRKYGRKQFEHSMINALRFICFSVNPKILKWTGIRIMDRDVEEFFMNLTRQTLEMRKKNNIVRKDFFQLLIQLRDTGNVQLDDEWQTIISNNNSKTISFNEFTAQVFLFYVAGSETSSETMTFCLYEIARRPDIQQKLQEEIDQVLAQHDGQLTYDSINELKYLDSCFYETLRLYSVLQFLNRVCTIDYKIPGTNVTLPKGTPILIPTFALHRDEKFYPDPLKFDPTRFYDENKSETFFPFGEGPRNCVGMRMGKLSVKVALVTILQQYNVHLDDRHIGEKLKFWAGSFTLTPEKGLYIKFTERK